MEYIALYIVVGLAVAFLDRRYIKYNASDLAFADLLEYKRIHDKKALAKWERIYLTALICGEVLVWPYVTFNYATERIRKKYGQKKLPETEFYYEGEGESWPSIEE